MSKIFLMTGTLAGLVGMSMGIGMGIIHDFTIAPAHAHLNLVGYVTMVLAGLFYDRRPDLVGPVAYVHYVLALVGAVTLTIGIIGARLDTHWGEAIAIPGSLVTFASMVVFVFQTARPRRMSVGA